MTDDVDDARGAEATQGAADAHVPSSGPSRSDRAASRRQRRLAAIRHSLVRWTMFYVILALAPIGLNAFPSITGSQIQFVEAVERGELLLVSCAIAAAAAGELYGRREGVFMNTKLILVGLSFVIVGATTFWYADVVNAIRHATTVDAHLLALRSTYVFIVTYFYGACCMALSQVDENGS